MKLHELAHARAGDKGDTSNISLFAYDEGDFAFLKEHITVEKIKVHFTGLVKGKVTRYELPHLAGFNFVLEEALGGGVTRSLALDPHGKSLSSLLLEMELPDSQS